MKYGYRWKPSRTKAREFAKTMNDINDFCNEHGIEQSSSQDSYYFTVNGQRYRVSNHSVESSNSGAFDWMGQQVRPLYHEGGRSEDVVYIHASKTRIREIYNDLVDGWVLDGKGNRKRFLR